MRHLIRTETEEKSDKGKPVIFDINEATDDEEEFFTDLKNINKEVVESVNETAELNHQNGNDDCEELLLSFFSLYGGCGGGRKALPFPLPGWSCGRRQCCAPSRP